MIKFLNCFKNSMLLKENIVVIELLYIFHIVQKILHEDHNLDQVC